MANNLLLLDSYCNFICLFMLPTIGQVVSNSLLLDS